MQIDSHAPVAPSGSGRLNDFFVRVGPFLHAVLRIGVAFLFMQHGVQKLFGWLGGIGGHGETVALVSQAGLAGVLEIFGGLLILLGLLTRPIAFVLMGEMIAAYVIAHLPQGGLPIQNQGELALLFALSFAFLFGNGAGPLSVDSLLARRHAAGYVQRPISVERPKISDIRRRKRDSAA